MVIEVCRRGTVISFDEGFTSRGVEFEVHVVSTTTVV